MTTDTLKLAREALQAARDCILIDRTSLADTHMCPVTNQVDAEGAEGLAEYDAVLSQIDAALSAAPAGEPVATIHAPADLVEYMREHMRRERAALDGFISLGNELGRAAKYDRWIAALAAPAPAEPAVPAAAAAQPLTLEEVRSLPTIKAPEIDGEESDGTPRYWRSRPYISLTKLERLLASRGIGAAPVAQQAAAQPVAQEPIAVVMSGWTIHWMGAEPIATLLARHPEVRIGTKLYTRPAALVGLSDEQIETVWRTALPLGDWPAPILFSHALQRLMAEANGMELQQTQQADTRKPCTCDGAGRGPGRSCVVKAGGRLGELWRCADGLEPAAKGGA